MNASDTDTEELEAPAAPVRSRRSARSTATPPPDTALDELDSSALDEDNHIRAVLRDERNNSANLEIYRRDKAGRWSFLTVTQLADWGPESKLEMSKQYGGGDYKARVRRQADGYRGTYGPTFEFTIDSALKAAEQDKAAAPDMRELVALMNQNDKTTPLFMQMMQMQQQASDRMMLQMQKSSENLVAVLSAAMTRAPAPSTSEKMMELLVTKAFNQPAPKSLDLVDMINAVAKLKNIANAERAEVAEDERAARPGMLDALIESVPALMKMLGGIAQPDPAATQALQVVQPAQAPRTVAPIPVAQPVAPVQAEPFAPVSADIIDTGPPPARDNDISAEDRAALSGFLPSLCTLADNGMTPAIVAQQVDLALDDSVFDRLTDLLKQEDWLAVLIDAHEPVQLRTPFFTQLRNELLAMVETD